MILVQLVLALCALILIVTSIITAFWGPRGWVIVSWVTSFLSGICIGLASAPDEAGLLAGIFFGIVLASLHLFGAGRVRRAKEEGLKLLHQKGIAKPRSDDE